MPSITSRLQDASEQLSSAELWLFSLVPLASSVLGFSEALKLLTADVDFHIGIRFGLPLPVSDPWSFVSTSVGSGAQVTGPTSAGSIALLGVGIVLKSILLAGYLGGLRDGLRGESPDFLDSIREQFIPFLGFAVVLLTLALPPMLLTMTARPPLAVVTLWLPVYFLLSYLLYATPYLVVLHDVGLGEALSWSVSLATTGGAYLRYALGYLVLVVVISIPATLVVANTGVLGIVLGVVLLSPVGLVFDTATLLFVADLTDAAGLGVSSTTERPHSAALSPSDPDSA